MTLNNIEHNINFFNKKLPEQTKLIAISKTKPIELIMQAYNAGQRLFGENKVQEMVHKHQLLPKDVLWHLAGHLQTNKVKYIAGFVNLIHSVDSFKLLTEINKEALKNKRVINCLLQVHIANEDTKFGLSKIELFDLLHNKALSELNNVKIIGLMGMATNTNNNEQIQAEFKSLKYLFEQIKSGFNLPNVALTELSMGMSDDYEIAVTQGSTMVRIGSAIFGERIY